MKITKFEQSGFVIETESGFRLAMDIGSMTPPQKLEKIEVDAMLVSHIHGDHFSLEQIKMLEPKKVYLNQECADTLCEEALPFEVEIVKVGDKIMIENIEVEFFNVDHGPNVSAPLQENFSFLINVDSERIYFAGDMFYESGIPVENLEVDYALLPVGTFYTFGPREALAFAKKFKRIGKIISMHYEKKPETRSEFIGLVGGDFSVE